MIDDAVRASTRAGVEAEINYVRNPPRPGEAKLEYVTEDEARNTMVTLPGTPMWITDGRGLTTDLDREGFVLVRHGARWPTSTSSGRTPPSTSGTTTETRRCSRSSPAPCRCSCSANGKKRYGETAADQARAVVEREAGALPARRQHRRLGRRVGAHGGHVRPRGRPRRGTARYAMYNLWRTVTPPPQDFPLAVCDAQSITTDDEVIVTAITVGTGRGRHRPRHDRLPPQPGASLVLLPRHDGPTR